MADFRWSALGIPGLSAVVGGAVGALLAVSLSRAAAPSDTRLRAEPPSEPSRPTQSPVDDRVAALESQLRALALKESVARALAAPASSAATEGDRPVADVAPIVDNPVFEAAVRDVMDRAEQERSQERESQRAEWRKRAADEWGTKLGEKLRLTEIQKAKVTEIAQSFWDRLRAQRQSDAGPPPSRQEQRERMAALRKTAEGELAKVLDPSQLTSYRELDEADQLGSARGNRGAQRGGRDAE